MSFNVTGRAPSNEAVLSVGSQAMAVSLNMTGGAYVYAYRFVWRVNGQAWQDTGQIFVSAGVGAVTYQKTISLWYSQKVDWYPTIYWVDAGGNYRVNASELPWEIWAFYGAPDTTDPVVANATPAAGNVAPGGSGVVFGATVSDNIAVAQTRLYIDGGLEYSWGSGSGARSHSVPLSLGPHTYEIVAVDGSGNEGTSGEISITVVNGLPEVPAGTIGVAGQTGTVEVANLGNIPVSWPAFLDGNPEDSLTYTLDERIAGGPWGQVVADLDALEYEWSPDLGLGSAELRVKANDGTGDSAYLTRTGITIVSSQSPTAPVIISPAGEEEWREGETHTIQFTPATHPEGLPVTIQGQFSKLGDFTDAVDVISGAENTGAIEWTLPTTLV